MVGKNVAKVDDATSIKRFLVYLYSRRLFKGNSRRKLGHVPDYFIDT